MEELNELLTHFRIWNRAWENYMECKGPRPINKDKFIIELMRKYKVEIIPIKEIE